MATYPSVNAANQYARDIVSGKISSCIYVKQSCQRHLDDLQKAKEKDWPYRFDKDKAERFCRFAQLMPHTKGEWAKRKLRITLEPWQLFIFCVVFGWVKKKCGNRRFTEMYVEVPRKNGKSLIAAAVGNYMFCA
ncbi:terminase large subunit, partial [Proteus mirabilis]